jgi:predicted DNA-binding protein YlxM (UPF0122 family)
MEVYPGLLTDKEKAILKMYIKPGVTGSAVARKFNVSRQAVHDHIKRALTRMESCEASVKFLKKRAKREKQIEVIESIVEKIEKEYPALKEETEQIKKSIKILRKNN